MNGIRKQFFGMIGLKFVLALFAMMAVSAGLNGSPMQDVKDTLFKEANKSLKEADEVRAGILAPKNYGEAMKLFREAESDYEKGKNLEDIRKKLRASVAYFKQAIEATKLAEVTFSEVLKARADAIEAGAINYATERWSKAEEKFTEAAKDLEDGDANDAKKKAGEAEMLFREAELAAIKANYLNETRLLLKQAKEEDVEDRAPKTLEHAKELVQMAEKELEQNRYDTDYARNLAQQAKYEAKHAIFLSAKIKEMKDSKQSMEELLLELEKPLQKIAGSMDMLAEFDQGFGKPADQMVENIREQQDKLQDLTQDLADREQQIGDLKARIAELEEQLGSIAVEQSELKERMESQEKIREQFAAVDKMFSREEAQVLRQKNDVIIRLVGLNFAVGKSIIEPQYFSLLTKVQKAINTFPESSLTIEGHTDSFGADRANLRLSKERAEAVRQYLLANMSDLDASKIDAVGYGESKPIANNETREGRAKNRRIDIVIHPLMVGAN